MYVPGECENLAGTLYKWAVQASVQQVSPWAAKDKIKE